MLSVDGVDTTVNHNASYFNEKFGFDHETGKPSAIAKYKNILKNPHTDEEWELARDISWGLPEYDQKRTIKNRFECIGRYMEGKYFAPYWLEAKERKKINGFMASIILDYCIDRGCHVADLRPDPLVEFGLKSRGSGPNSASEDNVFAGAILFRKNKMQNSSWVVSSPFVESMAGYQGASIEEATYVAEEEAAMFGLQANVIQLPSWYWPGRRILVEFSYGDTAF